MRRKTIAVCVTGFDLEYEMDVVRGIANACKAQGHNLFVFYNPTCKPQRGLDLVLSDHILKGEMMVYKLMDYDNIDGIVVFGESLLDYNTFIDICKNAREHNIPLIDFDDLLYEGEKRIILSNKYAMSSVVEHLITDHGLTKIDFINGFKDNIQSDERLEAYKTTLLKHGLPFEEDRVYYGWFWKKAEECTEEILKKPELPQAIVCANDTMSFFCMDVLKEHGLRIPEDIIVTGFDSLKDCKNYIPSPTTVRRATYEAGSVAVDLLIRMMNGEKIEDDTYVDSVLVKGQSCGCVPIKHVNEVSYKEKYAYYNDFKEFTRYLLDMNVGIANVEDSSHLFDSLTWGCQIFKLKRMYVCISSDVEKDQNKINIEEDIPPWIVPEKSVSMYQFGHEVPVGYEFPTIQLLPEALGDEDGPRITALAPLYFKSVFLGYLAAEPTTLEIEGDLLNTWINAICNNAGSFYMNNKLEKALSELEILNLHDPLTGMYNRRGLKKYENDYLKNTIKANKYLSVICADVDNLKMINDAYGHEEGDIAITVCSDALMEIFPKDCIPVRTGGDEFLILAAFETETEAEELIKKVYNKIEARNAEQSSPYRFGCSCGNVTVKPDKDTDLTALMSEADNMMYLEKHRRKTVRKY
ncbi:MAG: GGDEF domain-containing protein [Ruminococcus sp.]|nr:GGDEF domain-containing protein [Ruminococcus sp.]